jgi:hypothetical protein
MELIRVEQVELSLNAFLLELKCLLLFRISFRKILSVNSGFFSVFECSFIVLMIFIYDKPISVLFYDKPPTNELSQSKFC